MLGSLLGAVEFGETLVALELSRRTIEAEVSVAETIARERWINEHLLLLIMEAIWTESLWSLETLLEMESFIT